MSKLNCPLVKSQLKTRANMKASKPTKLSGVILLSLGLGLGFSLGLSLSLESSLIASLAQKETELIAIHAVADAIHTEKASVTARLATNDEAVKTAALAAL